MNQIRESDLEIVELRPPLLSLPILEINGRKSYEMTGSFGDIYIVDLKDFSCTCKDWTETRCRFASPDVRRACKHISRKLGYSAFVLKGNKLAGKLVPIPACKYRIGAFQLNGSFVIFRQAEDRRWFDVVAAEKRKDDANIYDVFGTDTFRWG